MKFIGCGLYVACIKSQRQCESTKNEIVEFSFMRNLAILNMCDLFVLSKGIVYIDPDTYR